MNLMQIMESLPPQVYIRRGELVIHFSSPSDLASRVSETANSLAQLERSDMDPVRPDGKAERGRRPRSAMTDVAQISAPSESEETPPRAE